MGATSPEENSALAQALTDYLKRTRPERTEAIDRFLEKHPHSVWRAALLMNLGIVYQRTGRYSNALAAWQAAWELSRSETEPRRKATADRALSEFAVLNARVGRMDKLEELFAETAQREIGGSAAQRLSSARQGFWLMRNRPEEAFRCGPLALGRIREALEPGTGRDPRLVNFPSTTRGTSLLQVRDLALKVGLPTTVMAKRDPGAPVLVPAVVHWKAGHFAAVVNESAGYYLVQDPTFGRDLWMSRAALDEEASGYQLVRAGPLPKGWRAVGDAAGGEVWGKGATDENDPERYKPGDRQTPRPPCKGMAAHAIHLMLVSLNITDEPLGYSPPVGPALALKLTYNQREMYQPQIFSYSNVGPKWTFDWMSYVQDDPANAGQNVTLYVRGGGQESFSGYSPATQSFAPQYDSRTILKRTATSPVQYERVHPDGSREVFGQPDGAATFPRKVFLTQWVDPQGNGLSFTYDADLRLVAATDAIGQVTTVSYDLTIDPLKITRVTDPFGREASISYDSVGRIASITDVIGLVSEFEYGAADFISAMTTPYGTTHFTMEESGRYRSLEVTDPLGGKERVEYYPYGALAETYPPNTEPVAPQGWINLALVYRNTFYWDKRAMALYPRDYTKGP